MINYYLYYYISNHNILHVCPITITTSCTPIIVVYFEYYYYYSFLDIAGSPGPGESIGAGVLGGSCSIWFCWSSVDCLDGNCTAAVLLAVASTEGSVISGGGLEMSARELICWLSGKFPNVMGAPVHVKSVF